MQTITEQGAALTVTTGTMDGIRHPDFDLARLVYLELHVHFGPGKYDYDCVNGWVQPNAAALLRAAPELLDGCNALLGLLQLIAGRCDAELLEIIRTNHRVAEAKAAVAKATGAA